LQIARRFTVLLDSELASLYQVETKGLTRAVRRNADRFPADFMYQLSAEEAGSLRWQIGALKTGRGRHRKYSPYVFTEQGVAMLSSVLSSKRAVQVNIEIMRAFVRLRQVVSMNKDLAHKLAPFAALPGRSARLSPQPASPSRNLAMLIQV
jgi:ORF6N domain